MRYDLTCMNCGCWFVAKNEDTEYCRDCVEKKKRVQLFPTYNRGGETAEKMFEIISKELMLIGVHER